MEKISWLDKVTNNLRSL